jgi:hypothetical protein
MLIETVIFQRTSGNMLNCCYMINILKAYFLLLDTLMVMSKSCISLKMMKLLVLHGRSTKSTALKHKGVVNRAADISRKHLAAGLLSSEFTSWGGNSKELTAVEHCCLDHTLLEVVHWKRKAICIYIYVCVYIYIYIYIYIYMTLVAESISISNLLASLVISEGFMSKVLAQTFISC